MTALGSVSNFVNYIRKIPIEEGCIRFYRGQSSLNYELQPSIYRNEGYKKNEFEIYHEVLIKCPESFSDCHTIFEELVKMQHYGVPTRLLDVTENPLVALYFACRNKSNGCGNAVVYYFDIPTIDLYYFDNPAVEKFIKNSIPGYPNFSNEYNKKGQFILEGNETPIASTICVRARLNNPRIIRQCGAFLLFGGKKSNDRLDFVDKVQKIEISKSHIKQILKELVCIGISASILFPEIESLAQELKNKFKN